MPCGTSVMDTPQVRPSSASLFYDKVEDAIDRVRVPYSARDIDAVFGEEP